MTKFSEFILNPGTAGPAIVQGIYALGFALRSEITTLLGKFIRVDQVQGFTDPEKAQGRANIGAVIGTDVQAYDAALQSLAGLVTGADNLPYTTAPDIYAVTPLTAFARTILDDTNAAGVRGTIGLGNVDNTSDANKPVSTAAQTALNLKANLNSPAFTGVPTTPTATLGTNTTQVASTAFVIANASGVGAGQTWQNVAGSRVVGTSYQNTVGRPIMVSLVAQNTTANSDVQVSSDGVTWVTIGRSIGVVSGGQNSFVVPNNWYYRVASPGSGTTTIVTWAELRP